MAEDHQEKAAEVEYELADMEEGADTLADKIEEARADWQRKQADPGVPGADDEARRGEENEGPPPEADPPGSP
jgi:hypothetical protein